MPKTDEWQNGSRTGERVNFYGPKGQMTGSYKIGLCRMDEDGLTITYQLHGPGPARSITLCEKDALEAAILAQSIVEHFEERIESLRKGIASMQSKLDRRPDWMKDVRAFHEKFGVAVRPLRFGADVTVNAELRERLIVEEFLELQQAIRDEDRVAVADGVADLIYVLIGACLTWGIPLDGVWNAVQNANMAKEGGKTREDGKILKPENWVGPEALIKAYLDSFDPQCSQT